MSSPVPAGPRQRPVRHGAARLEDWIHDVRERWARRRGHVPTVVPYTGYGSTEWVRVFCRVLTDGEGAEWCTIARNRSAERPRTYIALMLCHDGTDRAACVETDESFDLDEWASCRGTPGCFAAMCDDQWEQYGEAMDWFIADILRQR